MTPIGRGQRQLIIGDRKTGKTAVCVDTIINQKPNWETGDPEQAGALHLRGDRPEGHHDRRRSGSPWRTPARWRTPPSSRRRRRIRPVSSGWRRTPARPSASTGCTQGKHVLIIFDDLSKQAEAYRAISLLLRRPPGREAYPGDVFYLHSRLLERCAKLYNELGAGSMTGLPIIETKANDISAYIPTNVISITDGSASLSATCSTRASGRRSTSASRSPGSAARRRSRPCGRSVARCGWTCRSTASWRRSRRSARTWTPCRGAAGAWCPAGRVAQAGAVHAVAGRGAGRLDLAGTRGHLDGVAVPTSAASSRTSLPRSAAHHKGILDAIRETKQFSDDTEQQVVDAVDEFKKQFTTADGSSWASRPRPSRWTPTRSGASRSRSPSRPQEVKRRSDAIMAAQLRVLRRRIRSVQSTKKITKAMELIATSRIARAQARVEASRPYSREITEVLSALASAAGTLDHPLLVERENPTRAAMLVVTPTGGCAVATTPT